MSHLFKPQDLRLYLVAGSQDCPKPTEDRSQNLLLILEQALTAGITIFQFREKGKNSLEEDPPKRLELAQKCRELCRKYQVPFIVDDDLTLAQQTQADGIHVGQGDTCPKAIQQEMPKPFIIGLSCNTETQALTANDWQEVDYFGIGPIFPTQSKADAKPAVGTDFIAQLRNIGITKPLVAIGGIKADSVETLLHNGADGVAVISAITLADDVVQAVKKLRFAEK